MSETEAHALAAIIRDERGYLVDVERDGAHWVVTIHTGVGRWTAWDEADWPWLSARIIRAEAPASE
jgi:hypothetical protein